MNCVYHVINFLQGHITVIDGKTGRTVFKTTKNNGDFPFDLYDKQLLYVYAKNDRFYLVIEL